MTYRINDNGTDRDMTAAEAAIYEQAIADAQAEAAASAAALNARKAALASASTKLAALGLTDAEVAALLGGA
jgi:hypothetical protein